MAELVAASAGQESEHQDQAGIRVARQMGFAAVFVFAASGIGLTYSGLLPFSTIAGLLPGHNLVGILAVAGLCALAHACTFAVIGTLVPRDGADYILASRVLGGPLAFASSWTMVIFFGLAGGMVAASIAQNAIPMFGRILSLISFNKSMLATVNQLSTPESVVFIGTIAVVAIFLLLILPSRVTRRVLAVGFCLALAGWTVICVQLASRTGGTFPSAWERFMGSGAYLGHLQEALRLGMATRGGNGQTILAGMALGFWIFYGYTNPTLFAGEVKKPERNLLLGSWAGVLACWAVLSLAALLIQRVVPLNWLAAESYLSRSGSFQGLAMPWAPFYGAVMAPAPLLVWIVGGIWLFAILNLAQVFLYTGSRVMLAWAEDQILPRSVVFTHPELRSPLIAVLLVCIVAVLGVVDSALNGGANTHFNPVFFLVVTQILPVAGLLLLPFRRPDWYQRANPTARLKIGPIPLVTLFGLFSLLYLAGMAAALFLFPDFRQAATTSLILFVVLFGSGLAWYYGRRAYLVGQGQDFNATFRRIPEETDPEI